MNKIHSINQHHLFIPAKRMCFTIAFHNVSVTLELDEIRTARETIPSDVLKLVVAETLEGLDLDANIWDEENRDEENH